MQSDIKRIGALMISVIASVSLIWIFISSLLFPEKNVNFIINTGMLIFIFEFLSVHSSVMIIGIQQSPKKMFWLKVGLFSFYFLFVTVVALVESNWFFLFLFLSSLATKIFLNKAVDRSIMSILTPFIYVALLLISVSIVCSFPHFFEIIFPFPAEIMQTLTESGSTGLFIEVPQTLLSWGALYYSLSLIVNLIIFFVARRTKIEQPVLK
ncbi:MAG: hypothetical protein KKA62_06185 [Nanoarchaeota archaeon]|nr:hypothetical protein [Nanoarchaeota archaeon]MBU1644182.1 hypothetical protein [Nanoarchaeota archaeon]MBU1977513.1 hypothetical protein [Nanoarchaeota archaeon]